MTQWLDIWIILKQTRTPRTATKYSYENDDNKNTVELESYCSPRRGIMKRKLGHDKRPVTSYGVYKKAVHFLFPFFIVQNGVMSHFDK